MTSQHLNINDHSFRICILAFAMFSLYSCVEEIELSTENFESLIVIEANITDEEKLQEVYISRTFRFEDEQPQGEQGATVQLFANDILVLEFVEEEPGYYLSETPFSAQQNVEYSLKIQTQNGRNYTSDISRIQGSADIESISVQPAEDSFGNDGVSIQVNSLSASNTGYYFKFEYDETFKIIAPFWRSDDLFPIEDSCDFEIDLREQEERVCYNTVQSIDIILANTLGQPDGTLNNFQTRFMQKDNTIIAHRYSILLKQYIIPEEAYNYFEKRRELSTQDNLFSQTQPGFLEGNITSVESPDDERVIGIFYVSNVSKRRFFFNWTDVFPDDERPELPCSPFAPALVKMDGNCLLKESVLANTVRYWGQNLDQGMNEGPYDVVTRVCGDCTARGSNQVPDFWID